MNEEFFEDMQDKCENGNHELHNHTGHCALTPTKFLGGVEHPPIVVGRLKWWNLTCPTWAVSTCTLHIYGAFLCVGHLTDGKHFQHAHLVLYIG